MERPTLAEQLAERERIEEISKLSRAELVDLFMPHTPRQHISFWLFRNIPWIHTLIWKTVCYFYPYSLDTRSRHWRWE